MSFYDEIDKPNLKLIWKHRRPQMTKATLSKITNLEALLFLITRYITDIAIQTTGD